MAWDSLAVDLGRYIRDVPDLPQKGVLFRDITSLLGDPLAFHCSIDELCAHAARRDASAIVGIESLGFLLGAAMADRMRLPFVPLQSPESWQQRASPSSTCWSTVTASSTSTRTRCRWGSGVHRR